MADAAALDAIQLLFRFLHIDLNIAAAVAKE